ncbi:Reverse transcriptase (RNA-dependent DNA polymerase) [Fragilaria crotonensis]|nr:Reverse transcriptase (RNA-dependent DNA polymerase) [Fragilaria crotonensis]
MVGSICTQETRKDSKKGQVEILVGFTQIRIRTPEKCRPCVSDRQENGNGFLDEGDRKEIRNVFPAFEFIEDDDTKVPPGYEFVDTYFVFDIKMDLTRKARLVARGNMTEATKEQTFASVVSRDTVRLFFLLAALNDLDLLSCDIQNAYLAAPNKEKVWTKFTDQLGPEYNGKRAIIAKALYGLRSSGRSFRDYLAKNLRELGFASSKADPDLWMKAAVKPNGDKVYEYVISYVDDLIFQGIDPEGFMDALGQRFTLKPGSIKEPDTYLGVDIKKFRIPDSDEPDKVRWAFESTSYVKKAIADLEKELEDADLRLLPNAKTPLASGYRPELDLSAELGSKQLNYYQGLIGVLRWICEIGRIDVLMPVSLMSRYLVSARQGHLEQVFHIFAYLKHHPRSTMVFDDTIPTFRGERFVKCDWSEFYPDAAEAIPENMPTPRGKDVTMSCFVDADHAGCRETRRSHSGILIFVNRAPILWFSKRQNTVEASTYGSELLAMRLSIEMIEGLRYKLRMMGVPLTEECSVFCDNSAVVTNSRPESTLKKKHAAINFHRVREAIAAGTIRVAKENTQTNLADILTKLMPGPKMKELLHNILW